MEEATNAGEISFENNSATYVSAVYSLFIKKAPPQVV